MNKGIKNFLVCSFFAFSLIFVQTNDVKAQNGQASDFNQIIDVFYSALKSVKNLNYYTDEKIVFVIAGQEISFDVGAGHGNIFSPLKPVPAKIDPVKLDFDPKSLGSNASDKITISGLARVVIENELYKNAKDVQIFKWFIDFKLNPVQLFTFKALALLNTARTEGDWARIAQEFFCLLFRLSLVDDLEFVDKNKRLTSYLPASLNTVLKNNKFGLGELVDSFWSVLIHKGSGETLNLENPEQVKPVQLKVFVFRDEQEAKMVYDKFKDYTGGSSGLYDNINNAIKPGGYGIVGMSDFIKFRTDLADPVLGENKFVRTMVGHEEFLLSNASNKPVDLINQVNALQGKTPKLILAHDQTNSEYLVAYVSDDMSFVNTAKSVLLVLAQSFKDYLQAKKTVFEKTDSASLAYRAEFDAKEKCRISLEKFVRTQEGCELLSQIKNEIELIITDNSGATHVNMDKKQQEQISGFESEIAKLENQKTGKNAELAAWNKFLALQCGKNSDDIKAKIKSLATEISEIEKQIAEMQKALADINAKLSGSGKDAVKTDVASIEKDRQNLAKLYKILEEKQRTGGVPSDKLLNTIEVLEKRVASAAASVASYVVQKTIEEKLLARERIAALLESKAVELDGRIEDKLKELGLIDNIDDRVIQELLFDEVVTLQKAFTKQLQVVAKNIRQDNDKARKLDAYRNAFSHINPDKLSQEKQNEIAKLDLEAGYILDGDKQADFMSQIMLRDSFLEEFIKDMTQNSDRFITVKQQLQASLFKLLSNSSYLKNNIKLYKYLWRAIPYTYKSFLGCMGITEETLG